MNNPVVSDIHAANPVVASRVVDEAVIVATPGECQRVDPASSMGHMSPLCAGPEPDAPLVNIQNGGHQITRRPSSITPSYFSRHFDAQHASLRKDILFSKDSGSLLAPELLRQQLEPTAASPSVTSDGVNPVTFQRVGIHPSFLAAFPTRADLPRVRDYQLPHVPVCPGPYLLPDSQVMPRPPPTQLFWQSHPTEAALYEKVLKGGRPNYRVARVQVSSLPISIWQNKLQGYEDQQLISFLKFGWPVGFEGLDPPDLFQQNHGSACRHPEHIANYVSTELSYGALGGPFKHPPFAWLCRNPMLTREKRETGLYRVILDLSFPWGDSVNFHIDKHLLEGAPYKLHLPTPLDLAHLLVRHGRGSYMFKLDLQRAYRQLPTDPWDWPLLGIEWDDHTYFESIPFGVRHGAMACQRVTEAVVHVEKQEGDTDACGYVDDSAAVAPPELQLATFQYKHFHETVSQLGLSAALAKCVAPCTRLSWVGVTFDSVEFVMFIDAQKIDETLDMCRLVLELPSIRKRHLQSLLGKLNHSTKVTPHARIFLNKGFHMLRNMPDTRPAPLDKGFKEDLRWFLCFLKKYNGKALIRSFLWPSVTVQVDACLLGGGGLSEAIGYMYYMFPPHILSMALHISALELFNVLVALTIKVLCDNSASVKAIESGKSSCPVMVDILRELWAVSSWHDINILPQHKPVAEMTTPDLLSRAYQSKAA